jgi:hypothetical protein
MGHPKGLTSRTGDHHPPQNMIILKLVLLKLLLAALTGTAIMVML